MFQQIAANTRLTQMAMMGYPLLAISWATMQPVLYGSTMRMRDWAGGNVDDDMVGFCYCGLNLGGMRDISKKEERKKRTEIIWAWLLRKHVDEAGYTRQIQPHKN